MSETRGQIARSLIRFSLPLILSGVLQQLYSWADAFIVGNVEGELALAAIGATGSVVNFYLMAMTGFTLGLAILFARKYGSGEIKDIPAILATFSVLLGAVFLVLAAVGMGLTAPLLRLMDTPEEALALSEAYLMLIFPGVPFLAVYNVYSAALRGIGDSRAPFWSILVSSVINVALDVLFVAVLGWGVEGAAVATVIAQVAMTVFLVGYAVKVHPALRFPLRLRSLSRIALGEGMTLGVPPMIQSSINAFGGLILQNFTNGFGTATVVAISTAYRVDSIVLLPIINLGSGISTLAAQSHGAGDTRRARAILGVGSWLMTAVSLSMTVLVVIAGGPLVSIFGVGAEALAIGKAFFIRLGVFYILFGLATGVRSYLEALGDVVYSSVAGILSLGVRIVMSYVLEPWFGNMVIAYAEAIGWGVMLLMYVLRLIWKERKATE